MTAALRILTRNSIVLVPRRWFAYPHVYFDKFRKKMRKQRGMRKVGSNLHVVTPFAHASSNSVNKSWCKAQSSLNARECHDQAIGSKKTVHNSFFEIILMDW